MDKKKVIIIVAVLVIVSIGTLLYFVLGGNEDKEKNKNTLINMKTSEELYNLITNVNCDNTLIFDFKNKIEILVDDFTQEQRLDLIFRYLEINNKLDSSISKENFDEASHKVFGPNHEENFNIANYRYKDKVWNSTKSVIKSEKSIGCKEQVVMVKKYSFTNTEIGIEIGVKEGNKLSDMNGKVLGEYSTEEELNTLLDNSTAYYYQFELNDENYYITRVLPLRKVRGIE